MGEGGNDIKAVRSLYRITDMLRLEPSQEAVHVGEQAGVHRVSVVVPSDHVLYEIGTITRSTVRETEGSNHPCPERLLALAA